MNNVHSLYPAKLESYDALGNQYTLHLQGMSPTGITTLGDMPNLVIYDAATHFYFFLRVEWANLEAVRASFDGLPLAGIAREYVTHITDQVRSTGISIPETAGMLDIDSLITAVRDIGVTHHFGWLFRGLSKSFLFEIGAVFLQICQKPVGNYSIPMTIGGKEGYTLEFFVGPQQFRLNPRTMFGDDCSRIYRELEEWCNTAVSRTEHVKAAFRIPQ